MSSGAPLAIQFSDLRGFSFLTAQRGDQEAFQIARQFVELVEENVERHGGRLLKTYGDGVMTSFDDAAASAECSAAMQATLCDKYCGTDEEGVISAGVGLTWGDAIRTDDDLFGHSVNLAKRLADVAKGGQIVASDSLRQAAGDVHGVSYRTLGTRELKGVGDYLLHELVWRAEVCTLATRDDRLDLVVTEDQKLIVEFAKPIQEEIRQAMAEIEHVDAGTSWLEKRIKQVVGRRLARSIPRWIDWGAARAGLGLEHDVADVEAWIDGGQLVVSLAGKRALTFDAKMVDLESAARFVERLRALKAAAPSSGQAT